MLQLYNQEKWPSQGVLIIVKATYVNIMAGRDFRIRVDQLSSLAFVPSDDRVAFARNGEAKHLRRLWKLFPFWLDKIKALKNAIGYLKTYFLGIDIVLQKSKGSEETLSWKARVLFSCEAPRTMCSLLSKKQKVMLARLANRCFILARLGLAHARCGRAFKCQFQGYSIPGHIQKISSHSKSDRDVDSIH